MLELKPLCSHNHTTVEKTQGNYKILEISMESIQEILNRNSIIQNMLSSLGIRERLEIIGEMGEIWRKKLNDGVLGELKKILVETTGYCEKLIEMEFSLIPLVLNKENIEKNLEYSPAKSIEAFERFVKVEESENFRILPAGPVLIISSGNSLIPPLIPSIISLATGNLTIIKPSLSNYLGVVEVYRILFEMATCLTEAKLMMDALIISYFTHDSVSLRYLLSEAGIGVVNFWGGEPARSSVLRLISENPYHPKVVVNGPLTGCAIIDEESADDKTAEGLANNIVLYDQQLCSSPTSAVFIGSWQNAISFVLKVEKFLEKIGSEFESNFDETSVFLTESARRVFQLKGSQVLYSKNPRNFWTIAVSKGKSVLDEVVQLFPAFNIYARKRFLEIVVVDSIEEALEHIKRIPNSHAFKGVDGVQTVGYAVSNRNGRKLFEKLASQGIYRIVPLNDMFMRSAVEPYDGITLLSAFTKTIYLREKELVLK
ncbi:MAG: aldehyde dehydrogenase family protein [Thermoproteota archaeon]